MRSGRIATVTDSPSWTLLLSLPTILMGGSVASSTVANLVVVASRGTGPRATG